MSYFDQEDIEAYTGFSSSDFKDAGITMTATQWGDFCTSVVENVTQMINRYCNVTSFETHTVIEYHDGRGAQADHDDYIPLDTSIYLREYATGVATVYEDINVKTATEYWVERTERSTATAGDYTVNTRYELTTVNFHSNCPREGTHNIKIVYYAGYPSGAVELNEIKWIGLRIAKNLLLEKKKVAEAMTIRGTGVRDYAEMFKPLSDERGILTESIKQDLHKYRRYRMGGDAWA